MDIPLAFLGAPSSPSCPSSVEFMRPGPTFRFVLAPIAAAFIFCGSRHHGGPSLLFDFLKSSPFFYISHTKMLAFSRSNSLLHHNRARAMSPPRRIGSFVTNAGSPFPLPPKMSFL